VNLEDDCGRTVLHTVTWNGHCEATTRLLLDYGIAVATGLCKITEDLHRWGV
jgi:hypothetical protein